MSRSCKRFPSWSAPDSSAGRCSSVHFMKTYANRKVRRSKYWYLSSGMSYRKATDSWDIRDFTNIIYTKQAVFDMIEKNKRELVGDLYDHEGWSYDRRRSSFLEKHRKYSLRYYYYSK